MTVIPSDQEIAGSGVLAELKSKFFPTSFIIENDEFALRTGSDISVEEGRDD